MGNLIMDYLYITAFILILLIEIIVFALGVYGLNYLLKFLKNIREYLEFSNSNSF